MLSAPTFDLFKKADQFLAPGGQPVVRAVVLLVVLDEILGAQIGQGVGERPGVHGGRAGLGHRMVQVGVPEGSIVKGIQDRDGQLSFCQDAQ
jgi:hypothetical protein